MLAPLLKMQSLHVGRHQKVLSEANRQPIWQRIMFSLGCILQTGSPIHNSDLSSE